MSRSKHGYDQQMLLQNEDHVTGHKISSIYVIFEEAVKVCRDISHIVVTLWRESMHQCNIMHGRYNICIIFFVSRFVIQRALRFTLNSIRSNLNSMRKLIESKSKRHDISSSMRWSTKILYAIFVDNESLIQSMTILEVFFAFLQVLNAVKKWM